MTNLDDWYGITSEHLASHYGVSLVQRYGKQGIIFEGLTKLGNVFNLLKTFYPQHDWMESHWKNYTSTSKSQILLYRCIKSILPDLEIRLNYHHPDLKFSGSQKPMQLDIYIPQYMLCLEYQGIQHFTNNGRYDGFYSQQNRDIEKKEACNSVGITLVYIPYWWDFKKNSLIATIIEAAPQFKDLFAKKKEEAMMYL